MIIDYLKNFIVDNSTVDIQKWKSSEGTVALELEGTPPSKLDVLFGAKNTWKPPRNNT